MNLTGIEWADYTFNPVTGCTRISPGCANCYAERTSRRLAAMRPGEGYATSYDPGSGAVTLRPERLALPAKQKKGGLVFVCSMSDLFHEDVPFDYLDKVFETMAEARQHTFQVLTKRPMRMVEYLYGGSRRQRWQLPNVWYGVSIENAYWKQRIELLRMIEAPVRFLSCEPLLGDLGPLLLVDHTPGHGEIVVDWVIVGGESGPGARPMQLEWARSIRDQCVQERVPFFFKQTGATVGHGAHELDGVEWKQFPEVPRGPTRTWR